MNPDLSAAFVMDADAVICLHSLSLLRLIAERGAPQLIITEFVARHELCALAALLSPMERSGQVSVRPLSARDPNFKRFRRDGADKGEAEIIAWYLQSPSSGRPRFISNDRKARTLARAEGIHIKEDPDLVGLLAKLDVDTTIPEELYKAVAEVLAFVYRLNRGYGK